MREDKNKEVSLEYFECNKRNKTMRALFFNRIVVHNRKNKSKKTINFGQMVV